jgi:hypothetical protein
MSTKFGFPSRQREAKSTVLYPAEVQDDTDITETGLRINTDRVSFIRGMNFCTDLYRLYEHSDAITRARTEHPSEEPGGAVTAFVSRLTKHFTADCLHLVSKLYEALPKELKQFQAMTGDPNADRNGFIGMQIEI